MVVVAASLYPLRLMLPLSLHSGCMLLGGPCSPSSLPLLFLHLSVSSPSGWCFLPPRWYFPMHPMFVFLPFIAAAHSPHFPLLLLPLPLPLPFLSFCDFFASLPPSLSLHTHLSCKERIGLQNELSLP